MADGPSLRSTFAITSLLSDDRPQFCSSQLWAVIGLEGHQLRKGRANEPVTSGRAVSVRCSTRVWKHSRAKGSTKLTLLAIADHAQDDGTGAWPSQSTLAEKTGLSDRTIRREIERLEELGELRVEDRPGRSAMFTVLTPDKMSALTPDKMSALSGDTLDNLSGNPGRPRPTNRQEPSRASSFPRRDLEALNGYVPDEKLEDDILEMDKRWPVAAALERFAEKNPKLMPQTQSAQVRRWLQAWEGRLAVDDFRRPKFHCSRCGRTWDNRDRCAVVDSLRSKPGDECDGKR